MNDKLLEFWSNFFLNALKSKQKVGDLFSWMQQGMSGIPYSDSNHLSDLKALMNHYQTMYGIENLSVQSEEYKKLSAKAAKDFQQSFKDFMSLAGMVPVQEYLTLVRKYEKLKEKCQDQEETIKHLKILIDGQKEPHEPKVTDFQQIVKEQGDFFFNFLKELSHFTNDKQPDTQQSSTEDDSAATQTPEAQKK